MRRGKRKRREEREYKRKEEREYKRKEEKKREKGGKGVRGRIRRKEG